MLCQRHQKPAVACSLVRLEARYRPGSTQCPYASSCLGLCLNTRETFKSLNFSIPLNLRPAFIYPAWDSKGLSCDPSMHSTAIFQTLLPGGALRVAMLASKILLSPGGLDRVSAEAFGPATVRCTPNVLEFKLADARKVWCCSGAAWAVQ